jgi:SAM-dependent methyltransferase
LISFSTLPRVDDINQKNDCETFASNRFYEDAMHMNTKAIKMERALLGQLLYGDDFTPDEIAQWFADEREGYFNLYYGGNKAKAPSTENYEYEQLAEQHCFKWLPMQEFEKALGVGSAHGAELSPILERSNSVVVLEPSDGFVSLTLAGKPVTYVKPEASGLMPFESNCFDIIVCFSVLHHIPNVSTVINEMFRVLRPNGYVLLREPTHSMGDWRSPRKGLTKHERGIPINIFRTIIRSAGFTVIRETRCMFSLMSRLSPLIGGRSVWESKYLVGLDRFLCSLPIWSQKYFATSIWQKLRPGAVAYVLKKPSTAN